MSEENKEAYIVAVDMGYGHQRAAYPFLSIATDNTIINANKYPGISRKERKSWQGGRKWYEIISRYKDVPIIGKLAFSIMDSMQKIEPFYPRRDLSENSYQQKYFFGQVKRGLGEHLIKELNKNPLPFVTTFFVPAYFAEYYGYKGEIYCIICDADVARAWAPYEPQKSKIKYLVPNKRVKERLKLYGVKAKNIYFTGFPLPEENIGGPGMKILKEDLKARLYNLDPHGIYRKKYAQLIEAYLCPVEEINKNKHPITIMFAVGGAGAQRELGVTILESLSEHIKKNKLKLILVAGNRNDVYLYYEKYLKQNKIINLPGVEILYAADKMDYFKKFNQALRTTDILWTKPSELSFYCGLGIPVIMSRPIGSQEHYNRRWLLAIGGGVDSKNPKYANEWLFDWLESGWLAEAAMEGFLDAPKLGTYYVENLVLRGRVSEIKDVHLL